MSEKSLRKKQAKVWNLKESNSPNESQFSNNT